MVFKEQIGILIDQTHMVPAKDSFFHLFKCNFPRNINTDLQSAFYLSITSEFKGEEDCVFASILYFKHENLPIYYVFITDFILA